MYLADQMIRGGNCGQAWVNVTRTVLRSPGRKLLHPTVRINRPYEENPAVRELVGSLLAARGLPTVETVVNTVFPAALARLTAGPEELATQYRELYPRVRQAAKANKRGTYFGRMVEHPADGRKVDQLNNIIARLRKHAAKPASHPVAGPVYEMGFVLADEEGDDTIESSVEVPIYSPKTDSMPLGFPCMSHLSFQAVDRTVHAMAHFRSQYVVQRAYGNYLALGLLLRYVAEAAGLEPGALTVNVGLIALEGAVGPVETGLNLLIQPTLPDL